LDLFKVRRKEMAVQIYFETLASGMHAKLSSRYRRQNNHVHITKNSGSLKAIYPSNAKNTFLGDMVSRHKMFT
jgi:hypothetical protein